MMMTTYTVLTGPAHQMKSTTFVKRLFNVVRQVTEPKLRENQLFLIPDMGRGTARNFIFSGAGGLAAYPLPTRSNKTLQLQPCAQPGFCKAERERLKQKLKCSCSKKVAIGQHVEQTGAIQAYWVDGGLGAKPTVVEQFLQFFENITILTSFGLYFDRF